MKKMNTNTMRNKFAGRTSRIGRNTYRCPWNDFRSSSFYSIAGHVLKHADERGYFDILEWLKYLK